MTSPLNIIIVGGGIGGLFAANALIAHGLNVAVYEQAPAIGAKDKTLRVFTFEEGGYEHCQGDNLTIGIACIGDWLADRLETKRRA